MHKRSEPEASSRNRRHSAAVANSRRIESLRAIEHLTCIRAALLKEEHAGPSLQVIKEGYVFVRELVCSGRDWPNLYLLCMRLPRQRRQHDAGR